MFGFTWLGRHASVVLARYATKERGLKHVIEWPTRQLGDIIGAFEAIETVVEEQHHLSPWGRASWDGRGSPFSGSVFGFTTERDAVLFRLLLDR